MITYNAFCLSSMAYPNGTQVAGYYRDALGQDYAMARYYNATTGSFWSPDPDGTRNGNPESPRTWNRFSYSLGDPINVVDRSGKAPCGPVDDPSGANPCAALADGDDGDDGSGDICGGDAFNPSPSPLCYVPLQPPAPSRLPFECDATLYYRPVDLPFVGTFLGNVATHSYWEPVEFDPNIDSDILDTIVSGGPQPVNNPSTGQTITYLDVWTHSPSQGPDSLSAGTEDWSSGLSSSNCTGVNAMMAAALSWPTNQVLYGYQSFPNSNSVAHLLGGTGGFNPPAPPGSFGRNP